MSCTSKSNEVVIPEAILSKDSMIQILADIHLAESEATLYPYNDSLGIINLPAYYKYIFELSTSKEILISQKILPGIF